MNKLIDHKKFLTIGKTAKYLTENIFFEPTSEADILQLCLDGHLSLSVNIPQPLNVLGWKGEEGEQTLPPEPSTIIGLYDLLLDVGSGAEELQYRLKAIHSDNSEKPDKSVAYLLGNKSIVYELPVNYALDIVVRKSAITELKSSVIGKSGIISAKHNKTCTITSIDESDFNNKSQTCFENSISEDHKSDESPTHQPPLELQLGRKFAITQMQNIVIKAPNNQQLIDTPLSNLLSEYDPQHSGGFYRAFNAYVWLKNLEGELENIESKDYIDKADYDDRVMALNNKISEISDYINILDNKGNETKKCKFNAPSVYYGFAKLKDKISKLLNKTIYTEDIFQYALNDRLDIYWYTHETIRVSLSFDTETAKKIHGSDTWESLLHSYIVLPKDAIQVLMSGRNANLTFIDTDKNKLIATPDELAKGVTDCLVLDQNIKVLQTDKLFVKESDALELEKSLIQTVHDEFSIDSEPEKNTPKVVTSNKHINRPRLEQDKRLDDLEKFIILLTESAIAKDIAINVKELPIPKALFLDTLNKRNKNKSPWGIKTDAFETTWNTYRRRNMCGIKGANMKKGKFFLKNILG